MLRLSFPLLVVLFVIVLLLFSGRIAYRIGVRTAVGPPSKSYRGESRFGRSFFIGVASLLAVLLVLQFWLRSLP